jgi:hypothetical protein
MELTKEERDRLLRDVDYGKIRFFENLDRVTLLKSPVSGLVNGSEKWPSLQGIPEQTP